MDEIIDKLYAAKAQFFESIGNLTLIETQSFQRKEVTARQILNTAYADILLIRNTLEKTTIDIYIITLRSTTGKKSASDVMKFTDDILEKISDISELLKKIIELYTYLKSNDPSNILNKTPFEKKIKRRSKPPWSFWIMQKKA